MIMKNQFKYIILLALIISIQSPVFAIEDWGSVYESYDEAEYGKKVSEKEYQDAIDAINKYKNGKKIPKNSKNKEIISDKKQGKDILIFEAPPRAEPLFVLPINVSHEGTIIRQGFYLAQPINRDNKHFIRLTQGEGKIIADIEANVFKTDNIEKISDSTEKIFSEIIREEMLKITYSNRNLILEAYLWIQ